MSEKVETVGVALEAAMSEARRALGHARKRLDAAEAMFLAAESDPYPCGAGVKLGVALDLLQELKESFLTAVDRPPVLKALEHAFNKRINAKSDAAQSWWDDERITWRPLAKILADMNEGAPPAETGRN